MNRLKQNPTASVHSDDSPESSANWSDETTVQSTVVTDNTSMLREVRINKRIKLNVSDAVEKEVQPVGAFQAMDTHCQVKPGGEPNF